MSITTGNMTEIFTSGLCGRVAPRIAEAVNNGDGWRLGLLGSDKLSCVFDVVSETMAKCSTYTRGLVLPRRAFGQVYTYIKLPELVTSIPYFFEASKENLVEASQSCFKRCTSYISEGTQERCIATIERLAAQRADEAAKKAAKEAFFSTYVPYLTAATVVAVGAGLAYLHFSHQTKAAEAQ